VLTADEARRLAINAAKLPERIIQMNGSWHGPYSGTNDGNIVIEIDDRGTPFEGCAYAYNANVSLPATFAAIRTLNKEQPIRCKAHLLPLDPRSGEPSEWQHAPAVLQFVEEGTDQRRVDVFERDARRLHMQPLQGELKQQPESVAVGADRVTISWALSPFLRIGTGMWQSLLSS
jgi:hypothetical protein